MYKLFFNHVNKIIYITYIILSIINTINLLGIPHITANIINSLVNKNTHLFRINVCLFLLSSALNILVDYIVKRLQVKLSTTTSFYITKSLISHIQHTSVNEIQTYDSASLSQRIQSDSDSITSFSLSFLTNLLTMILSSIVSFVVLFRMSLVIGFISIFASIVYAIFFFIFKNKIFEISKNFKNSHTNYFEELHYQLDNILFIQIHSIFQKYEAKLTSAFNNFYSKIVKTQMFMFMFNSIDTIISLITSGVIYFIGGINVINNKIDIGSFSMLTSYFKNTLQSTGYFVTLGKEYQENLASYHRINELININKQHNGSVIIKNIDNVSVEKLIYKNNKKIIIDNFTYKFKKNKVYCIIGDNGKGKTTLINLILGIYIDEYEGNIFINEININEINMIDVRSKKTSVVEQVPYLFKGTIADNIFSNEIPENIDDIVSISHLTKQNVNSSGTGLSGGEKQKISIARIIHKSNSDLIILDEPTSAMDIEGKSKLIEYLSQIKNDKIIIIISHDKTIIDFSDEIIDMNNKRRG